VSGFALLNPLRAALAAVIVAAALMFVPASNRWLGTPRRHPAART